MKGLLRALAKFLQHPGTTKLIITIHLSSYLFNLSNRSVLLALDRKSAK